MNEYSYEINSLAPSGVNIGNLSIYANADDVRRFVNDPMEYHVEVGEIAEGQYNSNGILAQAITKITAAPTLDYVIIPHNADENLRAAADGIIKRLAAPLFARDALREYLLYGDYVSVLHIRNGNIAIKPLDWRYTRFTGTAGGDHLVCFDLTYFEIETVNIGVDAADLLKTFPDYFYKAFIKYLRNNDDRWLVLPQETTFAVKRAAGMLEPHGRSIALAALENLLFAEEYLAAQRNQLRQSCSELLTMKFPPGREKGSCALNAAQQAAQFDNFKNAIRKKSQKGQFNSMEITAFSVAPETEIEKIEINSQLLKDTLRGENAEAVAADLGMGLGAISGQGQQGTFASLNMNMELVLSEAFQFTERAQEQFEKLINYVLRRDRTDGAAVDFVFLKTSLINRSEAFKIAKDMYTSAGGSRLWLYATGTGDAQAYMRLMDYERAYNFEEKYPPHLTSATVTGDDLGGRPEKDARELGDKGNETRTNGGNENRG